MSEETGPIYGARLIDNLPIGNGGMTQAMPSRSDLAGVASRTFARDFRQGQRVVAGYEVLLNAWRRQRDIANCLADQLGRYTGFPLPVELEKAATIVDKGEE